MKANRIVYDIGSTFTKLTAFHLEDNQLSFLGRSQSPTTLDNIMEGVEKSKHKLLEQEVEVNLDAKVFSSASAAGGLRMVALGYMPHVTAKAAKEVAMNAGARVLEVISDEEEPYRRLEILKEIQPDIILLAGGTDGGHSESAVENAKLIVQSGVQCMIIVACNRDASGEVAEILNQADSSYQVVPNIMPTIHELQVKPAREMIHREFIKQLTQAKGIGELMSLVEDKEIRPTPGAVLLAAELLAQGTDEENGVGDVLLIDLGGATTDIHSVLPSTENMRSEDIGLIINNDKQASYRTVEGNLGLSVSATGIIDSLGTKSLVKIAEQLNRSVTITEADFREYSLRREKNPSIIAETEEEKTINTSMAIGAIHLALKRHAGYINQEFSPETGLVPGFPVGRDLRKVKYIIGIGGIFASQNEELNRKMVEIAFSNQGNSLFPEQGEIVFDQDYIIYALGVLGQYEPAAVLKLMKDGSFSKVTLQEKTSSDSNKFNMANPEEMDDIHKEWFKQHAHKYLKTKDKE